MDHDLVMMSETAKLAGGKGEMTLVPEREALAVVVNGETREVPLKPLDQLYGKGPGLPSVDPRSAQHTPLFLGIEEAIQLHYRDNRGLTDGAVRLALRELAMNPGSPSNEPLVKAIQLRLRLVLSLNDYARSDVTAALKRLVRSVDSHMSDGGPRGYLEFVRRMMRM